MKTFLILFALAFTACTTPEKPFVINVPGWTLQSVKYIDGDLARHYYYTKGDSMRYILADHKHVIIDHRYLSINR